MTMRDNRDYISVLLYSSYYTTITGRGVLLKSMKDSMSVAGSDTKVLKIWSGYRCYPRSPGTHIVGSWVIDTTSLYRGPKPKI